MILHCLRSLQSHKCHRLPVDDTCCTLIRLLSYHINLANYPQLEMFTAYCIGVPHRLFHGPSRHTLRCQGDDHMHIQIQVAGHSRIENWIIRTFGISVSTNFSTPTVSETGDQSGVVSISNNSISGGEKAICRAKCCDTGYGSDAGRA